MELGIVKKAINLTLMLSLLFLSLASCAKKPPSNYIRMYDPITKKYFYQAPNIMIRPQSRNYSNPYKFQRYPYGDYDSYYVPPLGYGGDEGYQNSNPTDDKY